MHVAYVLADGEAPTKPFLQIRRRGEMVRVRMSFENPGDLEPVTGDVFHERRRRTGRNSRRFRIVVEHWIDDRAGSTLCSCTT